jgi:hypothetical protein
VRHGVRGPVLSPSTPSSPRGTRTVRSVKGDLATFDTLRHESGRTTGNGRCGWEDLCRMPSGPSIRSGTRGSGSSTTRRRAWQAAEKGPSAVTQLSAGYPARSGTRCGVPVSTPHSAPGTHGYPSVGWVTPPCIWTFLSNLTEDEFLSILLAREPFVAGAAEFLPSRGRMRIWRRGCVQR